MQLTVFVLAIALNIALSAAQQLTGGKADDVPTNDKHHDIMKEFMGIPDGTPTSRQAAQASCDVTGLPENLDNSKLHPDWFEVKSQTCMGCYVWSAVAATRCAWSKAWGQVAPRISEQALIDCVAPNCNGQGGAPENEFDYMARRRGTPAIEDYPMRAYGSGVAGTCAADKYERKIPLQLARGDGMPWTNWGYKSFDSTNFDCTKKAINDYGCLVIPMCAGAPGVRGYNASSGIMDWGDGGCPNNYGINHVVALVGYGVDASSKRPYYVALNSWGKDWGQGGFFKVYAKGWQVGVSAPLVETRDTLGKTQPYSRENDLALSNAQLLVGELGRPAMNGKCRGISDVNARYTCFFKEAGVTDFINGAMAKRGKTVNDAVTAITAYSWQFYRSECKPSVSVKACGAVPAGYGWLSGYPADSKAETCKYANCAIKEYQKLADSDACKPFQAYLELSAEFQISKFC